MIVDVVFFDVGETLVDESRLWTGWADYLGVPSEDFLQVLYDKIERGEHHRQALYHFWPDLDVDEARRQRACAGDEDLFDETDLYPDAVPCLLTLRSLGLRVGIAGNQPIGAEAALNKIGFVADFVASSAKWGVEKPGAEFFQRMIELAAVPASRIAYVGDRLDNDIIPAKQARLIAIFIERGPWGAAHAQRSEVSLANHSIATLDELPNLLTGSH